MVRWRSYKHQAGLKIVGEVLPQEQNRVTLADEKDQYGLPVARVTFSLCDNDKRLIAHAIRHMTEVMRAAGGRDSGTRMTTPPPERHREDGRRSAHQRGRCRLPQLGRRNLWICDGSVFPTVGGVNPSLTIQAIACRTATASARWRSAATCRRSHPKDRHHRYIKTEKITFPEFCLSAFPGGSIYHLRNREEDRSLPNEKLHTDFPLSGSEIGASPLSRRNFMAAALTTVSAVAPSRPAWHRPRQYRGALRICRLIHQGSSRRRERQPRRAFRVQRRSRNWRIQPHSTGSERQSVVRRPRSETALPLRHQRN